MASSYPSEERPVGMSDAEELARMRATTGWAEQEGLGETLVELGELGIRPE